MSDGEVAAGAGLVWDVDVDVDVEVDDPVPSVAAGASDCCTVVPVVSVVPAASVGVVTVPV